MACPARFAYFHRYAPRHGGRDAVIYAATLGEAGEA